jgi:heme-degrading monooxygenase HmoA
MVKVTYIRKHLVGHNVLQSLGGAEQLGYAAPGRRVLQSGHSEFLQSATEGSGMVRVIIRRHCLPGREEELEHLLAQLRSKAMPQAGYVSGETLRSQEDPGLFVVLSTWLNTDQWRLWEQSWERRETSRLIAPLLKMPEDTSVFDLVWCPSWFDADKGQWQLLDVSQAE